MRDPMALVSPPDDGATDRERERELEDDERDRVALMEAWKASRKRHAARQPRWSHELIEEERGDR